MKVAVFTFGRFNPPTTGHAMLVQKLEKTAQKVGGVPFLFASPSQDPKKNPLTYSTKLRVLDKIAKKSTVVNRAEIRTPFDALSYLDSLKFDHVYMIVGSDRVREFKRNVSKYIGTQYKNIKKFDVVSAGQRDPDAKGVSGMSASKMRKAVVDGDLSTFRLGMPKTVGERDVRNIFKEIKKNMKLPEWLDLDELYDFIVEHGHEFSELDDLDVIFEAAEELPVYVVQTPEGDIEITRNFDKKGHKALGRSKTGTAQGAEKAPILNKGSIKSIIQPAIQQGKFRVTPTAKEFLDPDILKAAEESYTGSTSETEVPDKRVGTDKEKAKEAEAEKAKPAPYRRKSLEAEGEGETVAQPKVNVQDLGMNDLQKNYGVSVKKGGNLGLQLEFATVLLSRIASGQDIESLKSDPKFFTFSEEALKQAKGVVSQLGPQCLENLKHSTEEDIRGVGGGEPKTDLSCGDKRFSMKAEGGYQFSSANYSSTGKEFRRALEATSKRVAENPALKNNKYVRAGIEKMVESLEAFPKYLLNQEKIDAKVAKNPNIISVLQNTPIEYDDGRKAGMMLLEDGSINPECDFISAREGLDGACAEFLKDYNKAPEDQEEFMRLFKEELTHVQITGEGLGYDDERAVATHVLTPTGVYEASREYSKDLSEVNNLRLSVKEKKYSGVDVGQRTSARSEVRGGAGTKRAKELAQKHRVALESVDQDFMVMMEQNDFQNLIGKVGTSKEEIAESIDEEEFTSTMANVSDFELDMSYIPGMSIDDMQGKEDNENVIQINGKEIKIPVGQGEIPNVADLEEMDESFSNLFEVEDRADAEDTTSAKRREKYNQKNRRAKDQSKDVSKTLTKKDVKAPEKKSGDSIRNYYIVMTPNGYTELVAKPNPKDKVLHGPDQGMSPPSEGDIKKIIKDPNRKFKVTPTSRKFLSPDTIANADSEFSGEKKDDVGQEAGDINKDFEQLTGRAEEWMNLSPNERSERFEEMLDSLQELMDDEENEEGLDPTSEYVRDWYVKSRPMYDAYKDNPDSLEMYAPASEVLDFVNHWEELHDQYKTIGDNIKAASKALKRGVEPESLEKQKEKLRNQSRGNYEATSGDEKARTEHYRKTHKKLWKNKNIAQDIIATNALLAEVSDPKTGRASKKHDNGTLIFQFTSQDYTSLGWKLSRLAGQAAGGVGDDFRTQMKQQFCEEGEINLDDCDKIDYQYTKRDIAIFNQYKQKQQDLLSLLGAVNEDGTVTMYRVYYDDGTLEEGAATYSGSHAESWTLSSQAAKAHYTYVLDQDNPEMWDEDGEFTGDMKVLKCRVPLDRVISSFASDADQYGEGVEDGDASFNYNYQYVDEQEVIIDGTDLETEIHPIPSRTDKYDKFWSSIMEQKKQEKQLQNITIEDRFNLDWLRSRDEYIQGALEQAEGNMNEAFSGIFEKWEDNRDYKDEYRKFHSSAEARANRGARVQARRDMVKAGRVRKGDGKDVDHKVALSNGGSNDLTNLQVSSPSNNRGHGRVKQTEDYGAGFEGTPEYIKKLIKDTPYAKIPHNVGSMKDKGESNGTRLSKGR